MPTLYTLVEGQTEERFLIETLAPHLSLRGVFAQPPQLFRTSRHRGRDFRGGVSRYARVKSDIARMVAAKKPGGYVTTMLDYYALPTDFPGWSEAATRPTAIERVEVLEAAFGADVQTLGAHLGKGWFIPYIQLHEFEALILVDPSALALEFPEHTDRIGKLREDIHGLAAEEVDDGYQNAPSKRLIRFIPQYDGRKAEAGPRIAGAIGIEALRAGAPHFGGWLVQLERLQAIGGN